MALIKKFLVLLCISQSLSIDGFDNESTKDCSIKCAELPQNADECNRGCRFYQLSKQLSGQDVDHDKICTADCEKAYLNFNAKKSEDCKKGCLIQKQVSDKLVQEKESEPERKPLFAIRKVVAQVYDGFVVMKSSVSMFFLGDDNTLEEERLPGVMIIQPTHQDEEKDQKDEDRILGGDVSIESSMVEAQSSVKKVNLLHMGRHFGHFKVMMILGSVSLILICLAYCLIVLRYKKNKNNKMDNLSFAVQQEPLKLVRTEDLTKLCLMDEEEQAPPLPNKQDLSLPNTNV